MNGYRRLQPRSVHCLPRPPPPSLIGSYSSGKVVVNLLNEELSNGGQLFGNLFDHGLAEFLGGGALLLEDAAEDGADDEELVKLGLGSNEGFEGGVDVVGELASVAGNVEGLVKGQGLGRLGDLGALFNLLLELERLRRDGDQVDQAADDAVRVGGDSLVELDRLLGDGLERGLDLGRAGEGRGGKGDEGEELELHDDPAKRFS